MSDTGESGCMTERERLQLRMQCIDLADKSGDGHKKLESIMEAAERYAAFVFQTGDYAEKGKSHLSID